MAGIYIHIPFCKQACHYCDFHFSTQLQLKQSMVTAIHQELALQKNYLGGEIIQSIYLGGGTPSLLTVEEIDGLLHQVRRYYACAEALEVTLEANPDDISLHKLQALRSIGVNRLSIGVQTFHDTLLKYIHRAHSADKAIKSLEIARQAGFNNFNLDLIYAIPGQSETMLQSDLAMAMEFEPAHISAYCLTIEKKTVFGRWMETGKLKAVEEDIVAAHFHLVVDKLTQHGYTHYEISNFSLPTYQAQHNTNYWKRVPYLGVGPSAHSYNGTSRQHNVANNPQYLRHLQQGEIPSTIELLTNQDHINEYVMTSLRTQWGCDMKYLATAYDYHLRDQQLPYLNQLVNLQFAHIENDILYLTTAGKLIADKIAADLFIA